jgi:hypothetical protein
VEPWAYGVLEVFLEEDALILAYYTGPFTNRTLKKSKITKKV